MKTTFCLIFSLLVLKTDAQLKSLFSNEHSFEKGVGDIFKQFGFTAKLESDYYLLKKLNTDIILFNPGRPCFYEIFNEKFIVVTFKDSLVIPKSTSNAYFMFPRKVSVIIPIDSLDKSSNFYFVDFCNKVIIEDNQKYLPEKGIFYHINQIDLSRKEIIIKNIKSNKKSAIKFCPTVPLP